MTSLRIGLSKWNGKLSNYAKRYGVLEVSGDELPPPSALRKWRRQVPPAFAFSVTLPRAVAELKSGKDRDDALKRALDAATALQASVLVLSTPASVRPTKANAERIVALAAELPRNGHVLAWEPAGLWSPEEVAAVAAASGWLAVVDAAEHEVPDGPIVYTRLRAIGKATRLGPNRLQRLGEQLAERHEAYVIADPSVAPKLASSLDAAIAKAGVDHSVPQLFKPSGEFDLGGLDEEQ